MCATDFTESGWQLRTWLAIGAWSHGGNPKWSGVSGGNKILNSCKIRTVETILLIFLYFNSHFNNHSFIVIFGLWKILLNKNTLFSSSWSALYFTELIFQKTRILFHSMFSCGQYALYTEEYSVCHFIWSWPSGGHTLFVSTLIWCLPIILCESAVAQFIYCFFFFLNLPVVSSVYLLLIALSFSWSLPT